MAEKLSEVYEEYEIEVLSAHKGRGALLLKTDKGIRDLRPLVTSEGRLTAEFIFKELLAAEGFDATDRVVKNRDGGLITFDRYYNPFVMRRFFDGRELSITNRAEVVSAVKNLAAFHKAAAKAYNSLENKPEIRDGFNVEKKYHEMIRIKRYMEQRKKREFELKYLEVFRHYAESALDCVRLYDEDCDVFKEMRRGFCHGTYDQHSVLLTEKGLATISFDRFYAGNQLLDLYHYIRKALEKNQYDFLMVQYIIDTYDEIMPLTKENHRYIYMLLRFPEKFYKIGNQYMYSSKCYLSPKLMEKLSQVEEAEIRKKLAVNEYFNKYL